MPSTLTSFHYQKLRRALRAEAARRARGETKTTQLWEVKVLASSDYHRPGDIIIIETK